MPTYASRDPITMLTMSSSSFGLLLRSTGPWFTDTKRYMDLWMKSSPIEFTGSSPSWLQDSMSHLRCGPRTARSSKSTGIKPSTIWKSQMRPELWRKMSCFPAQTCHGAFGYLQNCWGRRSGSLLSSICLSESGMSSDFHPPCTLVACFG